MSRAFKIIYFFPYTDRNGKMQIRESSYFGIFPAVKYARNLKHFSRNFFLKCNYFTFLSLFSLRFVFQLSLLLFSSMSSWQLHFFAHQGFWKYCNNPAAELVELTRNWFRYSKTIDSAQRFVVAVYSCYRRWYASKKDWQNLEKYATALVFAIIALP